jgi:putative hydrolase of the HAD superfamily
MTFTRRTHWALIDADDTILGIEHEGRVLGTGDAYNIVLGRFADAMEALGFDRAESLARQQTIDIALCREHGFGDRSRFPRSFSMTYEALASEQGRTADFKPIAALEAIGWGVFAFPYRALPGALDALRQIHQHYNIAVVTKGEENEQRKKVFDSGCFVYADQVIVMEHKSVEEWLAKVFIPLGLTAYHATPHWAIGNAVKSDINPPLVLGTNAILVDAPQANWVFEEAPHQAPLAGQTFHHVRDIQSALAHLPLLNPTVTTFTR